MLIEAAMLEGIATLHDGMRVGDIGAAVQKVLDRGKYGIVRDLAYDASRATEGKSNR